MYAFRAAEPNEAKGPWLFRISSTQGLQPIERLTSRDSFPMDYVLRDLDMLVLYSWICSLAPITTISQLEGIQTTMSRLSCVLYEMQYQNKLDGNRAILASLTMYYIYRKHAKTSDPATISQLIRRNHATLGYTMEDARDAVAATITVDARLKRANSYPEDIVQAARRFSTQLMMDIAQLENWPFTLCLEHSGAFEKCCFSIMSERLIPQSDLWYKQCPLLNPQSPVLERMRHASEPLCRYTEPESLPADLVQDLVRIHLVCFPGFLRICDLNGKPLSVSKWLDDPAYQNDARGAANKYFFDHLCKKHISVKFRLRVYEHMNSLSDQSNNMTDGRV